MNPPVMDRIEIVANPSRNDYLIETSHHSEIKKVMRGLFLNNHV